MRLSLCAFLPDCMSSACVCLSENVLCMFVSVCMGVHLNVLKSMDGAVLIGKGTCQPLEGTFSSYFDTVTLVSHGWS